MVRVKGLGISGRFSKNQVEQKTDHREESMTEAQEPVTQPDKYLNWSDESCLASIAALSAL